MDRRPWDLRGFSGVLMLCCLIQSGARATESWPWVEMSREESDLQTDPADMRDQVIDRTQALWPEVAEALGLPKTGLSFSQLKVNRRFSDRRCALAVRHEGGDQFVLRAEFSTANREWLLGHLDRQKRAAEALAASPGISVPRILWQHSAEPYVLMQCAEGHTGRWELGLSDYGLVSRYQVLKRIGQAVAELHRVSRLGDAQFWPRQFLDRISKNAAHVRSQSLRVPRPHRFLGLCAYLHRAARRARGRGFTAALEHGDLHLRNILVAPDEVNFIDFLNVPDGFYHRDLANLWLVNCPDLLAEGAAVEGFGAVAQADWEAFEEGYGVAITEDPIFHFFYGLWVFNRWLQLAEPPAGGQVDRAAAPKEVMALDRVFASLKAHEASLEP